MTNGLDVREVLARLVGCRIVAIKQGFYVFEGAIDRSQCILQVQLNEDLTVHLWGSGDGETLAVITAPWNDPFLEPLSEENRAFVQKSGKWALFDTSTTPKMASLVGRCVRSVSLLRDQGSKVCGVRLETDGNEITYVVDGDEGFVLQESGTDSLQDLRLDLDPLSPSEDLQR